MGDGHARLTWLLRVVAAVVGLLLPAVTVHADAMETPAAVATYTYDSHHLTTVPTYTTNERGPPPAHDYAAGFGAVDLRSHGGSARLSVPTTPAAITYADHPAHAQVTQGTGTTRERVQLIPGDLRIDPERRVAANAVPNRVARVMDTDVANVARGWEHPAQRPCL